MSILKPIFIPIEGEIKHGKVRRHKIDEYDKLICGRHISKSNLGYKHA